MASKDITNLSQEDLEDRYATLLEQRDIIREDLGTVKAEVDRRLTNRRTAAILGLGPEEMDALTTEEWDALSKVAAKAGTPPGSVTAEVDLLRADGVTKEANTK